MAEGGLVRVRALGRDGPMVSALGLGLAALGRPGYINLGHAEDMGEDISVDALARRCHQVLDVAYEAGVRYFDVARSYGRAEAFLADWIRRRGLKPGDVSVGSKWGYTYTAGWRRQADEHERKVHTLEVFRRQWEETQALLGAHLSTYLIHSATLQSGVLDRPAVLSAMQRVRARTGVRIGLSLSGRDQAATLDRARALGIFDVVQATWNVLEPSVGPALLAAHADGMGVIVKEAVANGRLTPRSTALAEKAATLTGTLDQAAIACAMAQPFADVVLMGAATVSQLRSNLGARQRTAPDMRGWAEDASQYWHHRRRLAWS